MRRGAQRKTKRSEVLPGKPNISARAKTGCYTCRIRRKKCDEHLNEDGECEACVRLRLQCLGFGVKRPDWLRDKHAVVEIREKIKDFLSVHGMLKGGTGSCRLGSELPSLRLSEGALSSSSTSPSSMVSSLPEEPPAVTISSEAYYSPLSPSYHSQTLIPDLDYYFGHLSYEEGPIFSCLPIAQPFI